MRDQEYHLGVRVINEQDEAAYYQAFYDSNDKAEKKGYASEAIQGLATALVVLAIGLVMLGGGGL